MIMIRMDNNYAQSKIPGRGLGVWLARLDSALGNWRKSGGLYAESLHFHVTTITDR